ncbi:LysR family transcriptional regulator [Stenotrophomonas sp. SAM-B]|uniref:LysR family transcriptional regulator n=1 Tax=Stenotrophomonas sp. SAM-B TaxID=2729141 RepID=UPI0015A0DFAC|nr:LysR family transcriptional regulator [Stenotrophomonas sp. SAM-B]NWF32448.1 LysR family transcriptional regulator [Stenotrophomonas sp. SAM-B]
MRGAEFAELKAFVAVVDRGSFARAADHVGLSRSALSQIIRQLESRLGVRLLNRTTRSVSPTETGRSLHERIAPMFREMDEAVAQAVAAHARPAGTLRINTLSMGARKVIAPRLGRFAAAHPDVVLDIVIDDGLTDIAGEGFDAGIRVGGRLQKDMVAVRLTPDVQLLAVASPDYLARHGEPRSPADLDRHACINWRFPGSGKVAGWDFRNGAQAVEFFGEGAVIANHQDIVVPAALQGLGVFYAYDDEGIAEALADGRLKLILADWSPIVPGLYLYYSSRRHLLPALRAFIDCLLDRDR